MDNREMIDGASSWAKFIEECANSGKTVREFCAEHGVAKSTYYKWQKKIREMMLESPNDFI